jgi:excisionase family DNA binding protein
MDDSVHFHGGTHRMLILTFKEAAQTLKLGKRTLYDLVRRGKVPAAKFGHEWRFEESTLLRAFQKRQPLRQRGGSNVKKTAA